jgi:asparaginase (EC 3.5.1.1)
LEKISKWIKIGETVGAVAIDREGSIAAGTSSGGFPMKLPGRVGDVPIIGCSTFADNSAGEYL